MSVKIFYFGAIGFLFGVLLATFFEYSLAFTAFLSLLGVVGLVLWYRSTFLDEKIFGWLLLATVLFGVSLGIWRTEVMENGFGKSLLAPKVGEEVELFGVVVAEPDQRESSLRLFVEVGEDKLLVTTDRYAKINYGDEVLVKGKLTEPENFETDFGRVFDYVGYLRVRKVEYQISFAEAEVVSSGLGNRFIEILLGFKSTFMSRLERVVVEPASGLGEGLLLGVKQALGEELENAFQKTGIIHIVVLSGYNIMLVVAFVMFILGYFLSRFWRAVFGVLAVVSFAFLVGLSATVVRASIMAGLLLLAMALGRIYLVLRALLLAGVVMVFINPFLLVYDVGFQLSFLATLGLILIAPVLDKGFAGLRNFVNWKLFVVATVATQIAVTPLLLYQIGQFSLVSVLVNLLVLPMVPIAMFLTFATGMIGFVSYKLSLLLAYPTYWSLTYINSVALWFAELPFSAQVVPSFSFVWVVLSYVFLGVTLWWLHQKYDFSFQVKNKKSVSESNEKSNEDVSGWVIEEEDEMGMEGREVVEERATKSPAKKSEELPIFFK
ncbi:MAG: ComEC/Rec2 family competence protein [Candidatus Paceibacterota bacterium]